MWLRLLKKGFFKMNVDFFIVGAPKAGTTSLYHYLNEHLEVEMSSQKEPDYFSNASCKI